MKLSGYLAAGSIFAGLMAVTAAVASPLPPMAGTGLSARVTSPAGVTYGRHKVLPNKKRIHHERKS